MNVDGTNSAPNIPASEPKKSALKKKINKTDEKTAKATKNKVGFETDPEKNKHYKIKGTVDDKNQYTEKAEVTKLANLRQPTHQEENAFEIKKAQLEAILMVDGELELGDQMWLDAANDIVQRQESDPTFYVREAPEAKMDLAEKVGTRDVVKKGEYVAQTKAKEFTDKSANEIAGAEKSNIRTFRKNEKTSSPSWQNSSEVQALLEKTYNEAIDELRAEKKGSVPNQLEIVDRMLSKRPIDVTELLTDQRGSPLPMYQLYYDVYFTKTGESRPESLSEKDQMEFLKNYLPLNSETQKPDDELIKISLQMKLDCKFVKNSFTVEYSSLPKTLIEGFVKFKNKQAHQAQQNTSP